MRHFLKIYFFYVMVFFMFKFYIFNFYIFMLIFIVFIRNFPILFFQKIFPYSLKKYFLQFFIFLCIVNLYTGVVIRRTMCSSLFAMIGRRPWYFYTSWRAIQSLQTILWSSIFFPNSKIVYYRLINK